MSGHDDVPIFDNPRNKALLVVLTGGSAFYTYIGAEKVASIIMPDWHSHLSAVIFCLVSATCIYLIWQISPKALFRLETVRDRIIGACFAALGVVMITALSTWLNVVAIAGDAASVFHAGAVVATFEDSLESRQEAVNAVNVFKLDLTQARALYLARRDSEIQRGAYTGHPGNGTVARLLESLANRFGELDAGLSGEQGRMAGVGQQARHVLEAMRQAVNEPGDINIRMTNLAREGDKMRGLLSDLDAVGTLNGLRRKLQALPREVALHPATAKTREAVAAQKAALSRVETELRATVDQLNADLARLADTPPGDIPDVERITAVEAVIRYPLEHAPYWAGGIAMDYTPTLLLLFSLLTSYSRGRQGNFVDKTRGYTVDEILTGIHAQHVLRQALISQDAAERLHAELTGDQSRRQALPLPKQDDGNE